MTIKLIVGLANPGTEYIATRHNAGSWYVTMLAKQNQKFLKEKKKFYGYISRLNFGSNNVYLLVPSTFMNLSGKSIYAISSFYNLYPEEILVAHDELDLLPGNIRLKFGGGHGGHNGLKNIMSYFKNKNSNFYRLRIGIGHPGDKKKVINFVLGTPPLYEKELIDIAINKVVLLTKTLIIEKSKNLFLPSINISL